MTIKTKGSIPERILNKYQGIQQGVKGVAQVVPISTPNLSTNRRPSATKLSKYIDRNGGFNWSLFGMPVVARYPDGDEEIIDGGNRVAILEQILPEVKEFTACVLELPNKQTGKELFHNFNGTSSSAVSNECRFVNQVEAKENIPVNTKIVNVLKKTGVTVYEHEDCYIPISNKNPEWKINYKAIEWMAKKDVVTAIKALNLYTESWKSRGTLPNSVTNQLAKAFQQLFITYKHYFNNNANLKQFETFIKAKAFTTQPNKFLYKEHSHDRMEQRHLGTAYGIMQEFRVFVEGNSRKGGIEVPVVGPIQDLFEEHSNKTRS